MLIIPALGRQRQIDPGDHCSTPILASLISFRPVRDPVLESKVESILHHRNGR